MSESTLGEARVPIRATLDQLDKDLEKARGKVDSVLSKVAGTFAKGVQTVGTIALGAGGAAVGAIAGVGAAVGKLAADAAPLESIGKAFAGLAESAGSGADDMLAALKKGSAGMVSNRDLMMSFNQAAQLVSTDFAKQLPEAMGYLSKVSAATGEDMGFLLDSLVKGVGRVSPAILDNLQIQVSLAEATAKASEMFGVEADELTKTQQQAGMMAVTLEKLAANTAAMPDPAASAAAKMEQMKATFQDTKDEIGLAFLPVLNTVMGILAQLAERILPLVTGALETITPVVELIAQAFGGFISKILAGADPLEAFRVLLRTLFPQEVVDTVMNIITWVQEFIAVAQEALAPIMQWIGENVQLKDVLIALGIAIAAVVLPVIWSIISAAAPVIAAFVALIAIVAAVRAAWESDFLGIRTFVLETIELIKQWWAENGEAIMAKAKEIWEAVVEAITVALQTAWEFIQEVITNIKEWWAENGDAILAKAQEIWEAIVGVFEWFVGIFEGIFEAFQLAFQGKWYEFGEKLREVWDEVWAKIKEIGTKVWDAIRKFFTETDWGSIGRGILEGIKKGILAGVQWIKDAARNVAQAALDAAKGFLGIRSPSAVFLDIGENVTAGFAKGLGELRPVEKAMAKLTAIPEMVVNATGFQRMELAPSAMGGGMATYQIIQNFGTDAVRSEQDIYRLSEEMEQSLELRGIRRSIG